MSLARSWVLMGILALAAGCGAPQRTVGIPSRAPASPASSPATLASAQPNDSLSAIAEPPPELPADFPVPDGLAQVSPSGDALELVARWTSTRTGAAIYNEFVAALPAAGYEIRELVPGGAAAVIRIDAPAGGVWELSLFGRDPLTVELRVAPD